MTSRSDLSTKVPVNGSVPAKAFVLEVHTDDPDAYLAEIAGRETSRPPMTHSCPVFSRLLRESSG